MPRAWPLDEINVVRKVPKASHVRVGVVYPSLYHVAVDSLSFQMLYFYLNSFDEVYAERAFFLDEKAPPSVTAETATPLKNMDALIFTVHYELDFVNIVRILLESGVEPLASKRESPLVVIGGPPVISNPVPLAPFADILAVGEIEPMLPLIAEGLLSTHDSKTALLDSLPPERGFYVPQRGDTEVAFNMARELDRRFHPSAQVQPLRAPFKWKLRTAIEVSRGCFRGCAFCLEGRVFSALRERPVADVLQIALEGRKANRSKLVKLVSLSFFDHSQADAILEKLLEEGFEVSVPSLRADTLNRRRLELLRLGGQKTLVIAPETGSPRLGLRIGKYLPLEYALSVAAEARALGFTGLKLYLMVGLPGESEEDLEKTAEYLRRLSEGSGFKGVRQLKVTVSPFVPKPHTVLERQPFIGVREAKRRIELLRKRLGGIADVREYSPKLAWIQTIISRGDADIARVILYWALRGGSLGAWRAALKEAGVDPSKYTSSLTGELPWSFVKIPYVRRRLTSS